VSLAGKNNRFAEGGGICLTVIATPISVQILAPDVVQKSPEQVL